MCDFIQMAYFKIIVRALQMNFNILQLELSIQQTKIKKDVIINNIILTPVIAGRWLQRRNLKL
jgi:hypothetical protein